MNSREIQPETHIHDMSPFRFLKELMNKGGLGNYTSRAMVCLGTTVAGADTGDCRKDLYENFRHLQRAGIGTDTLLIVDGNNVAVEHMNNRQMLGLVRASIFDRQRPLRLYLGRDMEPLIQKLGLRTDDVLTPSWSIAERFDNKHKVRQLGAELGCDGFTPWRFLTENERGTLLDVRAELLAEAEGVLPTDVVFLKRPDFDGGEGILQWDERVTKAELDRFLDEHLAHGLLMEAGYPNGRFDMEEASVQIEVGERGWRPLYPSKQITKNNAHTGNELVVGDRLVPPRVWERMLQIIHPFADAAVRLGLGRKRKRRMGCDFLIVHGGGRVVVFLGEINARDTAPQYAYAVATQIASHNGARTAVVMENLSLARGYSHAELEGRLGSLVWNGNASSGVLIGNAGCISHGKVTLFSIGANLEEARDTRRRIPPL